MAAEYKFKRGDRVRLAGHEETMTVMYTRETFDCLGRSIKVGDRQ